MIFSPGIYEHAAALINQSPWDVSRDSSLLVEAHSAAWRHYAHPLVVVGIDVYNLEPEAYGAEVLPPKGSNIPSISGHPCEEVTDILGLEPLKPLDHARIRSVIGAGKLLQEICEGSEVRVPVCGPFALAIGLVGMNELLMSVVEDPDELVEALEHLLVGQKAYIKAIHDAGLRPIIFESGTTPPLLPVHVFEEIEAPLLEKLIRYAHELQGESPSCIIGGDAAPIAEALLQTGPGYVIAPSETDQRAFIETAQSHTDVHVRINFPATALLDESEDSLNAVVSGAVELANLRGNTSVGCGVVPYEADPAVVARVAELVNCGREACL